MFFMYSSIALTFTQDSLVYFSDLKFHSDFERSAINHFVSDRTDTFNLFLAIDENLSAETSEIYYNTYLRIFEELDRKKADSKNVVKKIKLLKTILHKNFLKEYVINEYFPVTLRLGTFNCVSASIIYALVLEKLSIPYKLMTTSNHVYLIANPGENSIPIETGNPNVRGTIFLEEFKQQFSRYLNSSDLINKAEYRNKSIEEIIIEQFSDVNEVKFDNLPGFQYYNKALSKIQEKEIHKTYELCQKAYFFSPDPQAEILLYNTLFSVIEKSDYSNISDVDYLAQILRFDNVDANQLIITFNNIINHYLQYTDKEDHCEALFQRFISQINNLYVINEVSFNYYLQMCYLYQEEDQLEFFVENALKIKGNNQEALKMLAQHIHRKLGPLNNPLDLLNSVRQYQIKYNYSGIQTLLHEYEMIAYLMIAEDAFSRGEKEKGEKYLVLFEENCRFPVNNFQLGNTIELTYFSIAINYFYKNNNVEDARLYANRGLRYLPTSKLLKSIIIY